jgi:hypothetical protein
MFSENFPYFKFHCQSSDFWRRASDLMVVVVVILMVVPPLLAEPLDTYCISKQGQRQEPKPAPPADEPARVTFDIDGEPFHIVAPGGDRLLLLRGEDTTPLAQVRAPQYEFGGIESLTLVEGSWLWIDGGETDYMAPLDLDRKPPTLGRPVSLPELYREPCSFWLHLWGCSLLAQGTYSATLDRVFITGHRITFWGGPALVTFEIVAGKAKLLPKKAQGARLIHEVPKLNGVLLRGPFGEALFYDGVAVTTLLAGSPDRSTGSAWRVGSTLGGKRIFLTDAGLLKSHPFLVELKPGPILTPISIPEEFANSWLSLLTLPNNPRLWGVTRHSVVAEVEGGLQTVVAVPAPSFIDGPGGPAGVWQAPDGSIAFVVRNAITGSSTDYFLVRASQTNKCKASLNPDKPILLGNE